MKLIKRDVRYRGGQFDVFMDEYAAQDGGCRSYEIVDRVPAVAMVPVLDGEVLMVRQFRASSGSYLLELPAGKLDVNETPFEAVQRELQEEVGYRAERVQNLINYFPSPGYSSEVIFVYYCSMLVPSRLEGDEDDLEVVRFPLVEAHRAIEDGVVRDGKSIIGLTLARQLLG